MKKIKLFLLALLFMTKSLSGQNYDIVIKGGHLIDPANNLDQPLDLAIMGNRIVAVEKTISSKQAKKIIDASGLIVSPGLIDMHTHNFYGTVHNRYLANSFIAVPPDGFTFRSGVTTVVDAGSPGWRNFELYKSQIIETSKTRVLCFLNIVGHGMSGAHREQHIEDMNPRMTAMIAKQNKDHVVGVKLAHFMGYDWTPTELAVEAGKLGGIPVMIDFGGSSPELPLDKLFLEKLRPGDIFTHAYAHVNGRTPIVGEDGKVRDYVFKAQKRGIVFDVGHGGGSFLFEQAVPAMEQGLKPDVISTDLHTGSMNGGMKNINNVMSKFLNMGLSIQEIIAATTSKPAKFIQRKDLGHLSVGGLADLTLINIRNGNFGFIDTRGKRMKGNQKLECELTIKDGKVVYDLNGLASSDWK
ncbi:MAG: amidohydrolase/deacetylase family metallohydrolase [Bacteroidota bacterium]|nr:amidohydrolase/deacetylase family metallohydrolase [Bacteroidota bacterium]